MPLPATDSFTNSDGVQIEAHGSWTLNDGDFEISSNSLASDDSVGGDENGAHWDADAFDNDQKASATVVAVGANAIIGVAGRCNIGGTANYYGYYGDNSSAWLFKVVGGSWEEIGPSTGNAFSTSDDIQIDCSGTTVTPLKNGSIDASIGAATSQSDLTSGSAGVSGYGDDADSRIDDWEGDNLFAAGATVTLNDLTLASTSPTITVSPGTASIILDALSLVGSAEGITLSPDAVSVIVNELVLASSPEGVTLSSGAVSVILQELGLTGSAEGITLSPGEVAIILNELVLSSSVEGLNIDISSVERVMEILKPIRSNQIPIHQLQL